MHSSVTLRAANLMLRSERRCSSGTSRLAARMAFSIFSTSKVTSEPLRLMIFMVDLAFRKIGAPVRRAVECLCLCSRITMPQDLVFRMFIRPNILLDLVLTLLTGCLCRRLPQAARVGLHKIGRDFFCRTRTSGGGPVNRVRRTVAGAGGGAFPGRCSGGRAGVRRGRGRAARLRGAAAGPPRQRASWLLRGCKRGCKVRGLTPCTTDWSARWNSLSDSTSLAPRCSPP